jgi:hypothetical protein
MATSMNGSPRALEASFRAQPVTDDFVHYVMHFAALREGRACETCGGTEKLHHAPPSQPKRAAAAAATEEVRHG